MTQIILKLCKYWNHGIDNRHNTCPDVAHYTTEDDEVKYCKKWRCTHDKTKIIYGCEENET